ncbi:MAG: helix-turn-helix domain-containing protein [Deltaproteobacteria bacterium]|nr:helix-turn-helix domain-containing protein [Deltaproteobacteria bacterium]
MQNKIFLSATEAGERYGISKWTLYLWASQGKLPSYKIGKLRRFSIADLDEFFEKFRGNQIGTL